MFDIGWMELVVFGMVALIVVGPKELPGLLRTIGKYVAALKRQAGEFRSQFDEAMRESEFKELQKDVESIGTDAEQQLRDVEERVRYDFEDNAQNRIDDDKSKAPGAEIDDDAITAEEPKPEPAPAPRETAANGSGTHVNGAKPAAGSSVAEPAHTRAAERKGSA